MEGYRDLLHQKASGRVPDFAKGPNDFYVAILSHNISVQSCQPEDFQWLRVNGKVTVAKLRNRMGSNVLLFDGTEVAKDDEHIRDLDHFKSGVVVFWTVVSDGRVPLKEVSAQPLKMKREESVKLEKKESWDIPSLIPYSPLPFPPRSLDAPKQQFDKLCKRHPNILLTVQNESCKRRIQCSDCPSFLLHVPLGEYPIALISRHLNTDEHQSRLQNRVRLMLDLNRNLCHRYGVSGLHIPTDGKTPCTLVPKIKCKLCPEWEHKIFGVEDVSLLLSFARRHLKSPGHPVEYKAEDIKEHMARSPVCRLSTSRAGNQYLLEKLRRRHPGSDLVLEIGGVSGALIRCRDCNVNFHIYPPNEAYDLTTIRKADAHFATSRHKRLAGTRLTAGIKKETPVQSTNFVDLTKETSSTLKIPKKRLSPRNYLNDLLIKLRQQHPHHKLHIYEAPRSLQLEVLCLDCPYFSYTSFLEDEISIAQLKLEVHLRSHSRTNNKHPRIVEELKISVDRAKYPTWYTRELADFRAMFPHDRIEMGFISDKYEHEHLHLRCLDCSHTLGTGCSFFNLQLHMETEYHRCGVARRMRIDTTRGSSLSVVIRV